MFTLFFIEFEGSSDDVALVVDYEYAFDGRFDSGDGLFDVLGHIKLQL